MGGRWSCAAKVEGRRKKGRLKRTCGKQVEEESSMMVVLWKEDGHVLIGLKVDGRKGG